MVENLGILPNDKNLIDAPNKAHDENRSILNGAVHSVISSVWGGDSKLKGEVENYTGEFIKAVPLFMAGPKAYAASAVLFGLDQAKLNDSTGNQVLDFGMGALKGSLTKGTFDLVGRQQGWGLARQGVTIGALTRAADVGLTRQTYLDKGGNFDLLGGAERTISTALSPKMLATDVVIFGAAGGLFKGLDKVTGGAIERSPVARMVGVGGTFGFTSGALGEIQRQQNQGEGFDLLKVLERGGLQAGVTGLAAIPGGMQAARMSQAHNTSADVSAKDPSATGAGDGKTPLMTQLTGKLSGLKSMLGGSDRSLLTMGAGDVPGPDGEVHRAGSGADGGTNDGTAKVEPNAGAEIVVPHTDSIVPPVTPGDVVAPKTNAAMPDLLADALGPQHAVPPMLDPIVLEQPLGEVGAKDTSAKTTDVPADGEHVQVEIPKGKALEAQQGVDALFQAIKGDPEAVQRFYDFARNEGVDMRKAMEQVVDRLPADDARAQAARRMIEEAYLPDVAISVPPGREAAFQEGAEILKRLKADPESPTTITEMQQFVLRNEDLGDAMKAAAKGLNSARVSELVDAAYAPARQFEVAGTPDEQRLTLQGWRLFEATQKPDFTQADVDRLVTWARGDAASAPEVGTDIVPGSGRAVEEHMLQLAKEMGGEDAYRFLRDHVYHGDQARISVEGTDEAVFVDPAHEQKARELVQLAHMASDASDPAYKWYTEYLYQAAKDSDPAMQKMLLQYAERSGNEALLANVRDGVANKPNLDIGLPTQDAVDRFVQLRDMIELRPEPTADAVGNYKARITEWLHNNPDLHPFVKEYAAHSEHSLAVSAIDGFFGTNFLEGFPTSQNPQGRDMSQPAEPAVQGMDTAEARRTFERPANVEGAKMDSWTPDQLIDAMFNGDRVTQERAAVKAQNRTGEMSDQQFTDYLSWLYSPSPEGNGRTNLEMVKFPSFTTMLRPEVFQSIASQDGVGAHFDIPAMREFFTRPADGPEFPQWINEYASRYADEQKPLPNWLINDIRSRWVMSANTQVSPENPLAVNVSPEIRALIDADAIAQASRPQRTGPMARKQRAPEAMKPDTLGDRINGLNDLIDLKDPALVTRLMELGGQDGRIMNDVVRKIQTYAGVPEYRELLSLTLPHAQSIVDVNIMLRSLEEASKLGFNPVEAQSSGRLAQSAADHMMPTDRQEQLRVSQIINDFTYGKTRLPRPPRKPFPGQEEKPGGRKPPEMPVAPEGWYTAAVTPEPAAPAAIDNGTAVNTASGDLSRDAAGGTVVELGLRTPVEATTSGEAANAASAHHDPTVTGSDPVLERTTEDSPNDSAALVIPQAPAGTGQGVTPAAADAVEQVVTTPPPPPADVVEQVVAAPPPPPADVVEQVVAAPQPPPADALQQVVTAPGADSGRTLERPADAVQELVAQGDHPGSDAAAKAGSAAERILSLTGGREFSPIEDQVLGAMRKLLGRPGVNAVRSGDIAKELRGTSESIIKYTVRELKRQGWLVQKADAVQLSPDYQELMKLQAQARKEAQPDGG